MNVTAGSQTNIQRVEVQLGNRTACTQVFNPPLAPTQGVATITCTINTAQLDSAGAAMFTNGAYELTARAYAQSATDPNGTLAATATFGTLILNNASNIGLTITTVGRSSATGETIGTDNTIWREGDVVVTARPAIFTPGTPATDLSSITICLNIPAGATAAPGSSTGTPCRTVTTVTGENAFVATFPKASTVAANGVSNVSNSNVQAFTTGEITNNGQPAPTAPLTAASPSIKLDNVGPTVTAAFPASVTDPTQGNNYLGNDYTFTATAGAANTTASANTVADPMPGVGLPATMAQTVTFYYTNAAGAPANTTAGNTSIAVASNQVTSASQIPGSVSNAQYILVARAVDRLGNATYSRAPTAFGIDLVDPTLRLDPNVASAANNSTNPALELNMEARDSISGLQALSVRIEGRRVDGTNTTTLRCYNNAGVVTATDPASGVCPLISVPLVVGGNVGTGTVNIPTDNNLYEIDIAAVDRAGNISDYQTYNALVDNTAPGATVTSTTTTVTGANTTVSIVGNITDNVDLRGYDVRLRFPTLTTIPTDVPFEATTQVGNGYGLPLVGLVSGATGSNTALPVRVIYETGVADVPTAFGFGALDVAGNYGASGFTGFAPAAPGTIADLNSFSITSSNATICGTGAVPPCGAAVPGSTTVSATINTAPAANNPITSVLFYYVHPGADMDINTAGDNHLVFISNVAGPTAPTQTGVSERLYTASQVVNGSMFTMPGNYQLVAIGVDAQGDAILSNVVPVTVQ
jgi:hypothetical protein